MKSKKIIFRADGNSDIGLGHLYRIFSLIEMLKDDYDFVLLTKETTTIVIIPEHYNLKLLPNSLTWQEEVDWIAENYNSNENIIIADGYQFDSDYQKQIKRKDFQFVYIDDLIEGKMYADIVVNHSPGINMEDYDKESSTSIALGTEYSMLRPKFLELGSRDRSITGIDSAFVCFGGADPFNLSIKAVKALLDISAIDSIHIVLGAAYKQNEIFLLEKENKKVRIYQNLSEFQLIEVMLQCNLAIVPSSTILYEICSVKMQVISGYYVDNQVKIYEALKQKNIFIPADDITNYTESDFKDKIRIAIHNKDLDTIIKNQKKLFDGRSKKRFLGLINQLNITFTKATEEDVMLVFDWSNDALVRKNSYDTKLIDLEDHKNWYLKKIKDKDTLFLIICINGVKAGIVRYELSKDNSVIGILIAKKYRGQKLASKILIESSRIYFEQNKVPILAYIKKENTASIKSFENANYKFFKEATIKDSLSSVYKLEEII